MKAEEATEGLKHDQGKQPWYAMPLKVLKPLADVFAAGEKKYATFNCLKPFKDPDRRFWDANMRHLEEFQINPHAIDPETNCYHGAEAAFNILMRVYHHKPAATQSYFDSPPPDDIQEKLDKIGKTANEMSAEELKYCLGDKEAEQLDTEENLVGERRQLRRKL